MASAAYRDISRRMLVYGGCGALGTSIVKKFKEHKWLVISVDYNTNNDADINYVITPGTQDGAKVTIGLQKLLAESKVIFK